MAYFSYFPTISYDFTSATDISPIVETMVDLSTRINMVISDQDLENLCLRYTIANGEMPEHISYNFYGTPDLAWTILYINGIGNINNEWPLTDIALSEYVTDKYGAANIYAIHHYEKLPEGVVMDQNYIVDNYGSSALNPVTNMDYESSLNETKRFIYIIKPENIGQFVKQYTSLLP
jgi:hypothetical protein